MSEFCQEEMDAITAMATAMRAPWEYAANAYRKAKAQYVPPGWTPARSSYVDRLLASGKWSRKARARR